MNDNFEKWTPMENEKPNNAQVVDYLPPPQHKIVTTIGENPNDYATTIYSKTGQCASTNVKAQQELVKNGFLIPKRINVGRRGAQPLLLTLTSKAKEYLQAVGESIKQNDGGRGGDVHNFFRNNSGQVLQEEWLYDL